MVLLNGVATVATAALLLSATTSTNALTPAQVARAALTDANAALVVRLTPALGLVVDQDDMVYRPPAASPLAGSSVCAYVAEKAEISWCSMLDCQSTAVGGGEESGGGVKTSALSIFVGPLVEPPHLLTSITVTDDTLNVMIDLVPREGA